MKNFLISICLLVLALTSRAAVQADFTPDKYFGCPPLLVNFTNMSTGSNATYRWDFGNGSASTLPNPSATFLTSGTYTVKLTVSTNTETDSIVKTITVFTLPQVSFTASTINACQKDTLSFISNIIPGDAAVTDYAWGFGDGIASSDTNARHLYANPGSYDITLVVQDANGCTANNTKHNYIQVYGSPTADFTPSPAVSCNASQLINFTNSSTGNGLTYMWLLDDSITSTQPNPSYTYYQQKRQVMLVATDVNGCTDTVKKAISVTELHANFTANKLQACAGETIKFTNTSNFPGTSWYWDFGDGTSANNKNPNKVYSSPGVYTVRFILRDGPCTDTLIKPNYITITAGFAVSFTANVSNTCQTPLSVNFTNTTPNGVQFSWTFGDGTTSTTEDPTKLYTTNGNFNVTLTVTDSNGCTVTGAMPGMISTSLPVPRFKGDSVGCPGNPIQFTNTSLDAVSYFWNFGDGDTSSLKNPNHAFAAPGVYAVAMTATNSKGCDSTLTKYVTIDDVEVDFSVDQTFSPCPPFVALFNSTTNKPSIKYIWDFGDGAVDTAANPTHIYFYPGLYTVKLIGTTPYGCSDTMVYVNLIEVQGPSAQFVVAPTEGCIPLTVTVSANASSNTQSMWADLGDGSVVSDSAVFSHVYNQIDTFKPKFILLDHIGCMVSYNLPPVVTHLAPQLNLKDTSVCPGSAIIMSAGNDTYQWSPATNLSCTNCANVVINPQQSIVYHVIAENQYGCQVSDDLHIDVVPLPELFPSGNTQVCVNQSVQLGSGTTARVSWSPAAYLSDSNSVSPLCTPQQTTTYDITAYNSLGCTSSAQLTVNVIDKVNIAALGDTTVCVGNTIQLHSTVTQGPDAGVALNWSPANYLDSNNIANPLATVANQGVQFSVIASSAGCAPDTAFVTINVSGTPVIEASEDVTTTPGAEVQVHAWSQDNLSYNWQALDSISCADCRNTSVYPQQTQTVFVTGTNAYGCSATDSIQINVLKCDPKSVYVPNTFTPNGDGVNDKLYLRSRTLGKLEYFRVFDEWGRLVFETNDPTQGWDGSVAGLSAPVAVYVYTIKGQCENGSGLLKSDNVAILK